MKATNFFETIANVLNATKQVQTVEKYMSFSKPEDFNQIRNLPFNREAKFRQDLANSMNEFGFIGTIDLIYTDLFSEGDEKGKYFLYVPDGQHRVITAMQLGLTVDAKVHQHKFTSIPEIVKFVSSLNSTQKAWSPMDYINCYVSLEMQEYITLIKVTKGCAFTVSTIALMLYGFRSKSNVANSLKNGEFVCNYLKETMFTLKVSNVLNKAIKQYDKKAKLMTNRMVLGLHHVTMKENFDLAKFTVKYVEKYKEIKEMNLDDYSDEFASWLS